MNIVAGDVVVAVSLPELRRFVFADEFIDGGLNQSRRRGVLELEHIAFGQQPVAEIDALELKRLAIRRDELLAFDRYELRLGMND